MKLLKCLTLGLFLGLSSFVQGQEQEREKYGLIISGATDYEHMHSINHADSILSENNYKTYIFDEDTRENYDVNGITTKKNLERFFENVDIDKNDLFLMYVTGHGNRDTTKHDTTSIINMAWGGPLKPNNLDSFLEKINPSEGVLLFTQCHSGEFGKRLGKDNYIAISTSSEDKSSYGTFFGNSFFESLNRKNADTNNDNKISVLESASYATSHDPHSPAYFGNENILFKKRKKPSFTIYLPFYNQPRINYENLNPKNVYLNKND